MNIKKLVKTILSRSKNEIDDKKLEEEIELLEKEEKENQTPKVEPKTEPVKPKEEPKPEPTLDEKIILDYRNNHAPVDEPVDREKIREMIVNKFYPERKN